jgi:hypothetical protein
MTELALSSLSRNQSTKRPSHLRRPPLGKLLMSDSQSSPMRSPRLKHHQDWKLLRSSTSREHLIGLWVPTARERPRSKVTREIRRLAHEPQRGPGGLSTKAKERAKAKLLKISKEKRRMSPLPRRSDRMNTPDVGVPVARNLAMDPLPGVGEERMTRRWPTPSASTRPWITTAEGCPVSGQRTKAHGVCRPWKFWRYRKRIDSTMQTPPMDPIQTVIPVDLYLLLSTRTSLHRHHHAR